MTISREYGAPPYYPDWYPILSTYDRDRRKLLYMPAEDTLDASNQRPRKINVPREGTVVQLGVFMEGRYYPTASGNPCYLLGRIARVDSWDEERQVFLVRIVYYDQCGEARQADNVLVKEDGSKSWIVVQ